MPGEHELAEIAAQLRRAVASALDLAYPDPEAVRLTKLADQIVKRTDQGVSFRCYISPVADQGKPQKWQRRRPLPRRDAKRWISAG
jgi:hypothetical protein